MGGMRRRPIRLFSRCVEMRLESWATRVSQMEFRGTCLWSGGSRAGQRRRDPRKESQASGERRERGARQRGGVETKAQTPDPGWRVRRFAATTCHLPTRGSALVALGQSPPNLRPPTPCPDSAVCSCPPWLPGPASGYSLQSRRPRWGVGGGEGCPPQSRPQPLRPLGDEPTGQSTWPTYQAGPPGLSRASSWAGGRDAGGVGGTAGWPQAIGPT